MIQTSNTTLAKEVLIFKHGNNVKNIASYSNVWGGGLLFWVRTCLWYLHFQSCLPKILWLFLLIRCAHEARLLTYHTCMSQPKKEVSRQRNKEGERKSPRNLYFPSIMPVQLVKWPSTGISKERKSVMDFYSPPVSFISYLDNLNSSCYH